MGELFTPPPLMVLAVIAGVLYATLHHGQGVSMRTLMDWLGHSMLETTIRYLAAAGAGSLKTRSLVDKTWAVLADDQEAPL